MRIIQFYDDDKLYTGIKTEKGIFNVTLAAERANVQAAEVTVQALIERGEEGNREAKRLLEEYKSESSLYVNEEDITYAPCVTASEKIICIGLNYARHAAESGMEEPKEPIVFSKYANALAAHKENIKLPKEAQKVDYEVELALVIGKQAKDVSKDEATQYIYGYCTSNDVSARDLQFKSPQWLLGKSCDGFCPVGPELVTTDEVDHPGHLNIKTYVNGEVRQDSNTSDLIFNCEQIVSYVSKYMTLKPGDIILTGTPEGVIMGYPENEQKWLKDGDVVRVEIEQLGSLENTFIAE